METAESGAFQRIKAANDENKKILEDATRESEEILQKARTEADKIVKEAESHKNDLDQAAHDKGFNEGLEKAFSQGKDELSRMIFRLEKILGETINKRNEIIESERETTHQYCHYHRSQGGEVNHRIRSSCHSQKCFRSLAKNQKTSTSDCEGEYR